MTSSALDTRSLSLEPYWLDTLKTRLPIKKVIPEDIDVLIIGGGYTGLSAARVTNDLGARTAVVDAGLVGNGASNRNGGMFGAHPRVEWSLLSKKFGSEVADEIYREALTAQSYVENLIKEENIDCDLERTGRIQLAWTQADFEKQKILVSFLKRHTSIKVSMVPRNQLSSEIKTNRYYGGILYENHCGINPAKLHAGFLNSLNLRDVPIIENTPIISITKENKGFRVRSKNQELFVPKVIMATNGYTNGDFSWFKRRVFPLPSYIISTEDLPHDLVNELSPRRRLMVETRAQHNYFRVSPDGNKIIFGGRASMKAIPLAYAAKRLKSSLDDIWPELRQYGLTNVWTGNTGFSFNQVPHVGQQNGIFYAMGFSGSGTVLAPYLGSKVAYLTFNDSRGRTAYQNTNFKTSPMHFLSKPYFLSVADFWFKYFTDKRQSHLKRK